MNQVLSLPDDKIKLNSLCTGVRETMRYLYMSLCICVYVLDICVYVTVYLCICHCISVGTRICHSV